MLTMKRLIDLIEKHIANNYSSKRQFAIENDLNYSNLVHFLNSTEIKSEPMLKKLCEIVGYDYDDIWFDYKFLPVLKQVLNIDDSYINRVITVIKEEINNESDNNHESTTT